MNSATLRRLAKDHRDLRSHELPPHWLFPPGDMGSVLPDDLTELVVLLVGPEGTPYSQGIWRLELKIRDGYPIQLAPSAYFKTRIWHPNVEENSGSVCVDTLKRDWTPTLTLRDILVTISCLLIQPNPDSALNSTAGHLLQDDYESFARHARLMTSINARIPPHLKEAARVAKERGNESGSCVKTDGSQPAIVVGESSSPSNALVALSPPQPTRAVRALDCTPRMSRTKHPITKGGGASESKENDATLSQNPIASPSTRDPTQIKRPLSEVSRSPQYGEEIARPTCSLVQHSPQNGAESIHGPESLPADSGSSEPSDLGPQMCKGFDDGVNDHQAPMAHDCRATESGRPAKRVCSHEGKTFAAQPQPCNVAERFPPFNAVSLGIMPADLRNVLPRKSSAPVAVMGPNRGARPRIGLRRL